MSDDNTEARATPTDNTPQDGQGRLDQLVKRASAKDAVKDFDAAAELYSQATELQTQLNGELSPDNADLLFAYGKSLYNVAVSKSDVLGSKVAGPPESSGPSAGNAASTASSAAGGNTIQNAMASGMAKKAEDDREKSQSEAVQNKPYFQFTGDENFDEEDEEDNDGAAGEEEEDDDDFANAFEVLDLARVLYHKKLGAAEEGLEKGKSTGMPADIKLIKEHLADTHDLQAEISLEAERFSDAVADLRTVLELRQSLFPFEDSLLAEAHYKLSLALEFASVHKQGEGAGEGNSSPDDGMRKEAVTHMERAIESCRIRISQAQRNLDDNLSTMDEDKVSAAKMKIANVKDIVGDMEQRVSSSPPSGLAHLLTQLAWPLAH